MLFLSLTSCVSILFVPTNKEKLCYIFVILFSKLHIHIYGLAFTICCSLILVEKFLRLKSVELLQSHGNCWHLFLILRNHPIKLSCYASMCTFTYCTAVIEYIYICLCFLVGNSALDTHDGGTTAPWVWPSCKSLIGGIQDAFEGIKLLIYWCVLSLIICFSFHMVLINLYAKNHLYA